MGAIIEGRYVLLDDKNWAIGQKVCVKTDITVDISIVMSV